MVVKIGHQGAGGHVAGNTLESMTEAFLLGADMAECDVYLTKDRIPILMHDKTLDRTTTGRGLVRDHTLEEIKKFEVYGGFQIPTLAEYVDRCSGEGGMVIELKEPCVDEVLRVIEGKPVEDFFFISFHQDVIQDLLTKAPDYRIGLLTQNGWKRSVWSCLRLGATYFCPRQDKLTKKEVDYAHAKGLVVYTWTANSRERIKELISYGVEGITTDYPGYFKEKSIRNP